MSCFFSLCSVILVVFFDGGMENNNSKKKGRKKIEEKKKEQKRRKKKWERNEFLLAFESSLCRGMQATLPDNAASALYFLFLQSLHLSQRWNSGLFEVLLLSMYPALVRHNFLNSQFLSGLFGAFFFLPKELFTCFSFQISGSSIAYLNCVLLPQGAVEPVCFIRFLRSVSISTWEYPKLVKWGKCLL